MNSFRAKTAKSAKVGKALLFFALFACFARPSFPAGPFFGYAYDAAGNPFQTNCIKFTALSGMQLYGSGVAGTYFTNVLTDTNGYYTVNLVPADYRVQEGRDPRNSFVISITNNSLSGNITNFITSKFLFVVGAVPTAGGGPQGPAGPTGPTGATGPQGAISPLTNNIDAAGFNVTGAGIMSANSFRSVTAPLVTLTLSHGASSINDGFSIAGAFNSDGGDIFSSGNGALTVASISGGGSGLNNIPLAGLSESGASDGEIAEWSDTAGSWIPSRNGTQLTNLNVTNLFGPVITNINTGVHLTATTNAAAHGQASVNLNTDSTSANSASTIVARDSSGNVSVSVITANQYAGIEGSGATTIDWSKTTDFFTNLSASITFAFANNADTETLVVKVFGDASHTVTWPGTNVLCWPGGVAPTQSLNAVDIYTFHQINGFVYGSVVTNFVR